MKKFLAPCSDKNKMKFKMVELLDNSLRNELQKSNPFATCGSNKMQNKFHPEEYEQENVFNKWPALNAPEDTVTWQETALKNASTNI